MDWVYRSAFETLAAANGLNQYSLYILGRIPRLETKNVKLELNVLCIAPLLRISRMSVDHSRSVRSRHSWKMADDILALEPQASHVPGSARIIRCTAELQKEFDSLEGVPQIISISLWSEQSFSAQWVGLPQPVQNPMLQPERIEGSK